MKPNRILRTTLFLCFPALDSSGHDWFTAFFLVCCDWPVVNVFSFWFYDSEKNLFETVEVILKKFKFFNVFQTSLKKYWKVDRERTVFCKISLFYSSEQVRSQKNAG